MTQGVIGRFSYVFGIDSENVYVYGEQFGYTADDVDAITRFMDTEWNIPTQVTMHTDADFLAIMHRTVEVFGGGIVGLMAFAVMNLDIDLNDSLLRTFRRYKDHQHPEVIQCQKEALVTFYRMVSGTTKWDRMGRIVLIADAWGTEHSNPVLWTAASDTMHLISSLWESHGESGVERAKDFYLHSVTDVNTVRSAIDNDIDATLVASIRQLTS